MVLLPVPRSVDKAAFEAQKARLAVRRVGPIRLYAVDESLDWTRQPVLPVAYCRYQIGQGELYDLQPLSLRLMKTDTYKYKRIEGWLRQNDPRVRANMGYQQHKAMMILGSGRFYGQGGWKQAALDFQMLPEDHTDFIFSVVGGQWGFVGCAAVLFSVRGHLPLRRRDRLVHRRPVRAAAGRRRAGAAAVTQTRHQRRA